MQRPTFVTTEKKHPPAGGSVLIVDKKGIIGGVLAKKLSQELSVVYISKKPTSLIPENKYSYIFVVDDETSSTRESLSGFIDKAEKDKACFIFLINISEANQKHEKLEKLITRTISQYKKVKVIIYGDIISKNTYPSIILQAIKFGRIEIEGDGLKKTYPVFLEDIVGGIIEVAFGSNTDSSLFYLFPKYPPTQLTLAHMIQKANPNIRIDFIKDSKKEQEDFVSDGRYLLVDNYPLEQKIRELNIETSTNLEPTIKAKKRNLSAIFGLLLFFFIFLTLPLIVTLSFSFLGLKTLESTKSAIDKGNLVKAQNFANLSKTLFYLAKNTSALLLVEARLIGKENKVLLLVEKISFGENISQVVSQLLDASNRFSEDFTKATSLLKDSIVIFQKIQAENLVLVNDIDPLIRLTSNTIDFFPSLFGINREKIYLVLFQNNMELRPGGGFIGSYGLLTLDNGKIKDFSIHDVYDADGQLRGHVEPPYPIRRYLPSVHWYLRDSNFDVDFAKSASMSAFFLNLETGQNVDGVIAVDVSFVKNLLNVIGSVYVPDYKEKVNSNNLFELTESHAEKNSFPGSRQKKDFLSSLFSAIKLNIFSNKNFSQLSLAKVVSESILQKHLLFAFSDSNLQDVFTVNNWSGALWDSRQEKKESINDFAGINEANLGVNKTNYFIKRKISENVSIEESGQVLGEITVAYKNTSNSWPGGDYKNYLRFIVPQDADLLSVIIDGVSQSIVPAITNFLLYESKNFVPPVGLEVDKTLEGGKTIYGFLVTVKTLAVKTIIVKYSLPKKVQLGEVVYYNLHLFKQPGTDSYPFDFSLSYPSSYNIVSSSKGIVKKEGKALFSKILLSDEEIFVNLAKQ